MGSQRSVVGMIFLDAVVLKVEAPDHVAPLVGEKRKRDPVLLCEGAEDLDGIVADAEQGHALSTEHRPHVLQLYQLRAAEGSPVRAPKEDHEGFARAASGV